MQLSKKGQALVEFVIILPIFVFMIFGVIDSGKILYMKNNLESQMDDIITAYKEGETKNEIIEKLKLKKENIILSITEEQKYLNFQIEKETDLITPGLNSLLGNPYKVSANRVIYDE